MKGPLTILAPQATLLVNLLIFVHVVTVRTQGPECFCVLTRGPFLFGPVDFALVPGFLFRVGQQGPGVEDKDPGLLGECELVDGRVQEGRQLLELGPNELPVPGVGAADLENREVVQEAVSEAALCGEQDVGDGDDPVSDGGNPQVGISGFEGVASAAAEVSSGQEVLG